MSTPRPPIERLLDVMRRLRDPKSGCPWDVEQSFATIAPYTIEEAYEVVEAIQQGDMDALKDELGDLLLQVVFHAQMADEAKKFDFDAVAAAIADKMIRRHPHVFGDVVVDGAAAQTKAWETQKAEERAAKAKASGVPPSALDGVTVGLPALTRALKLQKRAGRVGFDWKEAPPILDKIAEELDELSDEMTAETRDADRIEDEMGDLLFACVNLARHLDVDPESALRRTNAKFERRFRRVEGLLAAQGKRPEGAALEEMERLWEQAKREERGLPLPSGEGGARRAPGEGKRRG
ncbi:MAG: nucleoside triphosphate pyrophosphohydrolase [Alphaproteobacteria bacterium]|nr:nucleoside triphosphate pyrophosphohydrolase [Alphaproteobacteria bacterium]